MKKEEEETKLQKGLSLLSYLAACIRVKIRVESSILIELTHPI